MARHETALENDAKLRNIQPLLQRDWNGRTIQAVQTHQAADMEHPNGEKRAMSNRFEKAAAFIRSWEKESSPAAAGAPLGLTDKQAINQAGYLRKAGIPLKHMPRTHRHVKPEDEFTAEDWKRLREVWKEATGAEEPVDEEPVDEEERLRAERIAADLAEAERYRAKVRALEAAR
jgi:hypothetical protein